MKIISVVLSSAPTAVSIYSRHSLVHLIHRCLAYSEEVPVHTGERYDNFVRGGLFNLYLIWIISATV